MRIAAFLFALLGCVTVSAQKVQKQKFVVLSPALLNYGLVAPQVGYGVDLNDRWSVLGEFAFGARSKYLYVQNVSIYRLSGELKWFPQPDIRKSNIAFQLYYAQRSAQIDNGSYLTRDHKIFNYQDGKIHSPALGYAVKLGRQETIGKSRRFFLDGYIGAGGRFFSNHITAQNVAEVKSIYDSNIGCVKLGPNDDFHFNYPKHVFDFYLGIRVGYRF